MRTTSIHAYAFAGIVAFSSAATQSSMSFSLSDTAWQGSNAKKVDPNLLYAIALAESRTTVDGMVRPWPWAINAAGSSHYFDTRIEAEAFLDDTLSQGVENVDVGPLQINLKWHGHRVNDPKELFDLPTTVRVATDILHEAMQSSPGDEILGIGRYHHWRDENLAREYGVKVLRYLDIILQEARRGTNLWQAH